MAEPNSQTEKPEDERRYDPELLKRGLRCDLDQYEMLKRCSDNKDITDWNEWRKENPVKEVFLEGADLSICYLKGAYLHQGRYREEAGKEYHFQGEVHLRGVDFTRAHLEGARLKLSSLEGTRMTNAHLERAVFYRANLKGAEVRAAHVDGSTSFWKCEIDRDTDLRGIGLDSCRVDTGTKQLLEYNNRRLNWELWYKEHWILRWPVRWFWLLSDYGLRTWRIMLWFFGLAFAFALVYRLWPSSVVVNGTIGDIQGLWHAVYFSVVTMTTLGFGDIAANPDSWLGQTLLMVQVLLGYVLLAALVTRFAVLFTAGGPAGKFADEKEE
ncbi:MAG: pentapeptide repeat-containing protein [Planctomycetota bacterium]|jgi:hypothetical protein